MKKKISILLLFLFSFSLITAAEKEEEFYIIKILEVNNDGLIYEFYAERPDGSKAIYRAKTGAISLTELSTIKVGDILAVRDDGTQTASLPPQFSLVNIKKIASAEENREFYTATVIETSKDGETYEFYVVRADGSDAVYRADENTVSTIPLAAIKKDDTVAISDNGIQTLSLPPQLYAEEIRLVEAGKKGNEIFTGFDGIDKEDSYSLFSYSYGYIALSSMNDAALITSIPYFTRGLLDALYSLPPLLTNAEMDEAIDYFFDEVQPGGGYEKDETRFNDKEEFLALGKPETDSEKYSYSYAYYSALNAISVGIIFDSNDFMLGFLSYIYGEEPLFSEEEIYEYINNHVTELEREYNEAMENLKKTNLERANSYLSDNRKRPGIVELSSGVQIEYIKKGSGKIWPKDENSVVVTYKLYSMDGVLYDQGDSVTLALNSVIKGFADAVKQMVEGDEARVSIPPSAGYGENASPPLEPNMLLIFDITLEKIID